MTDLSTPTRNPSLLSARPKGLRFPTTLIKRLFSARRTPQVDTCNWNEGLISDIGASRSHKVPPIPRLGGFL